MMRSLCLLVGCLLGAVRCGAWDYDYDVYDSGEGLPCIVFINAHTEFGTPDCRTPWVVRDAVLVLTIACSVVLVTSGLCLLLFTVWSMYLEVRLMKTLLVRRETTSQVFRI